MLYAFGDAILDTQRYELRCAGILVELKPKAYQMLVYLVQHHDRVVSRQELQAACWAEANVHESAVSRGVSAIRRALGAHQDAQRVIQTIHGKGYRCIVPVLIYSSRPTADASEDVQAVTGHRCAACHCENTPTARFCTACGTPLPLACPACRQRIAGPATFCPTCGNRLPTPFSLPSSRS